MDLIEVDYTDMSLTATGFQDVATRLRTISFTGISSAESTYGHAGLAVCMNQMLAAFEVRQDASADAAAFISDTLDLCGAGYKAADGWGAAALDGIRGFLHLDGDVG